MMLWQQNYCAHSVFKQRINHFNVLAFSLSPLPNLNFSCKVPDSCISCNHIPPKHVNFLLRRIQCSFDLILQVPIFISCFLQPLEHFLILDIALFKQVLHIENGIATRISKFILYNLPWKYVISCAFFHFAAKDFVHFLTYTKTVNASS